MKKEKKKSLLLEFYTLDEERYGEQYYHKPKSGCVILDGGFVMQECGNDRGVETIYFATAPNMTVTANDTSIITSIEGTKFYEFKI
jgi:hypothetical protein